jgi:starch phosphorylase
MKAALNGGLNCSILDGWWAELDDGANGWAIPSFEEVEDLGERDRREADALFRLLEEDVVPLFYDDRPGWLAKVRHSLDTLAPEVDARRMMRDYVENYYEQVLTAR